MKSSSVLQIGGGLLGMAKRYYAHSRYLAYIIVDSTDQDGADLYRMITGQAASFFDFYTEAEYKWLYGQPPAGWRETTEADIRNVCGGEAPNLLVISIPFIPFFHGEPFKIRAIQESTIRMLTKSLKTFSHHLPDNIVIQNTRRLRFMGNRTSERMVELLAAAGYRVSVNEDIMVSLHTSLYQTMIR